MGKKNNRKLPYSARNGKNLENRHLLTKIIINLRVIVRKGYKNIQKPDLIEKIIVKFTHIFQEKYKSIL